LCAGCDGRAVVPCGSGPGAQLVRDCSTGRAATNENGRCSIVDSSSSRGSVLTEPMLAVPCDSLSRLLVDGSSSRGPVLKKRMLAVP
jgi:hypothetical protein